MRLRDAVQRAAERADAGTALVLHDPLTGLYNRPFLLALIGLETRRAERYGGASRWWPAHLRGCGRFRKQYGKAMAERLLVYTAVVLGQTVREADVVARVSDDEFALLLPGTPAEAVPSVLTRIDARFEMAPFPGGGQGGARSADAGGGELPGCAGGAHSAAERGNSGDASRAGCSAGGRQEPVGRGQA